jgi:transcriptional regulator with XRE-family HTH domain
MHGEKMGSYIKEQRLKQALTRDKLAQKLNMSPSYLNQIERGLRIPSIDLVVAIAKELNISSSYLITLAAGEEVNQQRVIRIPDELTEEDCKLVEEIVGRLERLRKLEVKQNTTDIET